MFSVPIYFNVAKYLLYNAQLFVVGVCSKKRYINRKGAYKYIVLGSGRPEVVERVITTFLAIKGGIPISYFRSDGFRIAFQFTCDDATRFVRVGTILPLNWRYP